MQLFEFFEKDLEEGVNDPYIFKAVFMAGPPGAGKNTVIRHLGLSQAGLKLQDIDQTLALLKKAKIPAAPMDYTRGLKTTVTRQSVYQQNMLGLIINATGRDSENLMKINRELKQAGYDTFMVFVDVEYDVAWQRVQDREKNATDPADQRPVDLDYFVDAYDSSKKNIDFYALMFGGQFALVTNNVEHGIASHLAGPTKEEPRQMYEKSLRHSDKKVSKFLAKPLTPIAQQIVDSAKSKRQ
jgi:shikimate kinase